MCTPPRAAGLQGSPTSWVWGFLLQDDTQASPVQDGKTSVAWKGQLECSNEREEMLRKWLSWLKRTWLRAAVAPLPSSLTPSFILSVIGIHTWYPATAPAHSLILKVSVLLGGKVLITGCFLFQL